MLGKIREIIDNSVVIDLSIDITNQPNLVNLHVVFEDGDTKVVGEVVAVENYGAGDFFEIAITGKEFVLIPNEDDFVLETNVKTRTLVLAPNALESELV